MGTAVAELTTQRSTTWATVGRRSGTAEATLLAVATLGLRDLEAAAMTLGVIVTLALTKTRWTRLAFLGLGLLSANVGFWMGSGAISNVIHGEGFWETALPATLTSAAALTVIASAATLLRRPTRFADAAQGVALGLVGIALVASAVGLGERVEALAGDIQVIAEDVKFSDTTLEVAAGEVGVFVANKDLFWHTFTVAELDVNVNIPVGAERRTTFDAPAGTYEFVCAIPGHGQAGMKGTLTVR
jgi:uncharacterized cupredoxin-like copper-binding protein